MSLENPNSPLLSIVTVTWNAKKYAQEYLHSLRQVNHPPLQIVVVDNASTDGTPELIEAHFQHVTLVRNDANFGFARANNIGMQLCRGTFIALINSDVVVPPECLGTL